MTDQHYNSEAITVHNLPPPAPVPIAPKYPPLMIFCLGFMAACQAVLFILIYLMHSHINDLEREMREELRSTKSEVIQLWKRG